MRVSERILRRLGRKLGSVNCRPETLTEMEAVESGNWSCQRRSCLQACEMTQAPMGMMRPEDSAMETCGPKELNPPSEVRSRVRASKPTTSPVGRETIGS